MIAWKCRVPVARADEVEAFFWGLDAQVVASSLPLGDAIDVVAYFTDDQGPDELAQSALLDLVGSAVSFSQSRVAVSDEGWQQRWRDEFKPFQVGPFTLAGDWQDGIFSEALIRVYPGQAFGTGQHETTYMMLEMLGVQDLNGKRVLDIGCGTGILAIGAEKRGAERVLGIEIDPDCRENMQHHLRINACRRVELNIQTLDQVNEKFDVILANITLNVLLELWPLAKARLRPGGVLYSTGILAEQSADAMTALKQIGAHSEIVQRRNEWVLIRSTWP